MDNRMQAAMAEATRLTRAGRLAEANALIQQVLQGVSPANGTTVVPDDTIIDAESHVVNDTPTIAMRSSKVSLLGRNCLLHHLESHLESQQVSLSLAVYKDLRTGLQGANIFVQHIR
ncbi:MAG: hypothetical protein ACR2H5_14660 [Ktedonobacteraceae bacterium]